MENKFKAFALSALACATMGLASCSTIEAELPTEIQDEPILNLDGVVNNDCVTEATAESMEAYAGSIHPICRF